MEQGEELAFIVGHYKSGSTWLANLLSLHPSIRGLSETHVFRYTLTKDFPECTSDLFSKTAWSEGGVWNLPRHRLAALLGPLRPWLGRPRLQASERPTTLLDLSLRDQILLRRLLLRSPSKEEYCRQFFSFLRTRLRPGRYLVEKTPTNIPYVPYILSIFPRAKLLAVYRDGRDVVVSDHFYSMNIKHPWSFDESVRQWREHVEAQLEFARQYAIFACSYESLLEDGRTVVRRLFQHLDITLQDSTLDDMLERSSLRFLTKRGPGEEDPKSFYRKGVSGDWRGHFTSNDKERFKQLAGDSLIKLGYERDFSW